MEEELLTDEEVTYLVIKYLYDQKNMGREYIALSELYKYLGNELPDDEEDMWFAINDKGIEHIENLSISRSKYMN
jgi:hypothetical protein